MITTEIKLVPDIPALAGLLKDDLKTFGDEKLKELSTYVADFTPDEMRGVMGSSPGSEIGQPPGRRSGSLQRSLSGKVVSGGVEIEMAEHGGYLDPNFAGEFKGGGWLNRPFIDEPIDKSLVRALARL